MEVDLKKWQNINTSITLSNLHLPIMIIQLFLTTYPNICNIKFVKKIQITIGKQFFYLC